MHLRALRPSRSLLLAGVSGAALSAGIAAPGLAASPRSFSPAWFAARVDASTAAAAGTQSGTLASVTRASRNLATLTSRLQAMQAAQAAAASAALAAATTVPDGLVTGGLQIAPGVVPGAAGWTGAALPTQSDANGRAAVVVRQTQPQAMLSWQTFNVGAKTDLTFDQSAGGGNATGWVVLNRVEDPAAAPSRILGSITAPGKVYVINGNGIVFGAGAQVDLGALIASTADISAAQFASGIYGAASGSSFLPSFTGAPAGSMVLVEQGARIDTPAPASVTAGGGSVLLLGDVVENDGSIATPQGQTVLAAGEDFILRPGFSTSDNQTATVRGSQVAASGGTGSVTNAGLLYAPLGDVTMAGRSVTQAGIVLSTTSVNVRGTIHLLDDTDDAIGMVTLAPGSVTSVDPDDAPATALDSERDSLIAQSAADDVLRRAPVSATNPQLGDVSSLPDRLDQSRIEIVTGGTVAFAGSSLTLSQGGQVAVQAGRAAAVEDGAQIDVSGSTGAVLPASSNALMVNIQGNELRDAPVNRDTGLLASSNVSLDVRDLIEVPASSADPSDRYYTRGGLLEVGGYLATIGHTIDEWAAPGGTITLAARAVITAPQSELNVAGGAVTVQAGTLAQSYLIGADGRLYNANTAPANVAYVGVYGGYTMDYARFGGSDTWVGAVADPAAIAQSGYSYGRDAGSVVVTAQTTVLEGTIDAGANNGARQSASRPVGVTDPYAYTQETIALPGTLALGGFDLTGTVLDPVVTIGPAPSAVADAIIAAGALPDGVASTARLSAALLDGEGLGGLSVITGKAIAVTAPLSLAPGGTLTLAGGSVSIGANLTARGGRITIGDTVFNPVTAATQALLPADGGGGVVINHAAVVDLRGQWTNAISDPASIAGAGLVNGGTLAIDSARALYVAQGTTIDASAGGALLAGGALAGGTGGSVTLTGDDPAFGAGAAPVLIGAVVRDAGVNGGGTLGLTAPKVSISADPASAGAAAAGEVLLAPAFFQSGFSDYVVNGFDGLDVAPATVVSVAEPVYVGYGGSFGAPINAPTGSAPDSVFQLLLPPTFATNRTTARLTQRQGASIALLANDRPGQADLGGGAITIGAGAAIDVDPGQSVRIEAAGQITDDGAISAPGGSVAIVNEQRAELIGHDQIQNALSLSVWIGGDARIDVAGLAATGTDLFGRAFGTVSAGGSVALGSDAGIDESDSQIATDAFVLVRPGAVIDASGASAVIDLRAGTPVQLSALARYGTPEMAVVHDESSGGTIGARSYSGISLDGTLLAAAGGPTAAGGTLLLTLETPVYANGTRVPSRLRRAHVLTISTDQPDALAGETVVAGKAVSLADYGTASVSQQLLDAGGFGTAGLYARDAFVFQGDVALGLPGAITLSQGILTDSDSTGRVTLAAPRVELDGETTRTGDGVSYSVNTAGWHPYAHDTAAMFSVNAGIIDVADAVRFGVTDAIDLLPGTDGAVPTRQVNLAGFAQVALNSGGDIRFATGSLTTPGDLTLTGAQIYPTTGAVAQLFAGYDEYHQSRNLFLPAGSIRVHGLAGVAAPVPYSVGGSLALYAGAIIQDGVIRAPEGTITLGGVGVGPAGLLAGQVPTGSYTRSVALLPGSVTSVSLDGLTVPYGGTVDGVSYLYDGSPAGSFSPSITLAGQTQSVGAGAVLDLSGGGTLSGAGFVSGRGGSTNVLTTPSIIFDAATGTASAPDLAAAPVYAILPGFGSGYAPVSPLEATGSAGAVPAPGSQITLGPGVPGFSAGTYTLLPSYFALLPGAARVQVELGAAVTTPGVIALGADSYATSATRSVAGTQVQVALPVPVIVTSAAGVALASQFDQQSYSSFELAQASKFGTPRGPLPEDGKTLNLTFPADGATGSALSFAGSTLFAPVAGGFGGAAQVGGVVASTLQLEITGDGAAPTAGFTAIAASALDALDAPRLVIGGLLQRDALQPAQLDFVGTADAVAVRDGAVLRAPELFLTAGSSGKGAGAVSVDAGAVLDTVGAGAPPFDSDAGYVYNAFGYTLVALSNGRLTFTPNTSTQIADGAITIADAATLDTEGTLTFATDKGLSLGTGANYGARYLSIDVDTINVLSEAAVAQNQAGTLVLPSGLTLTQDVLSRLLAGDPGTGTPALQSLVLTADKSIDFAGSVSLDTLNPASGTSSLEQLVLNTPAIYGAGSAGDVATITTGTLYWNGIETTTEVGGVRTAGSALPGGEVAGGPGTGLGRLDVVATDILLGYGPDTTPDETVLDRLIVGFGTVELQASHAISGTDRGTLSVYQTQGPSFGAPGTGGALDLVTPLLTGAAGSVTTITAGAQISLTAPAGAPAASSGGALGAEIDLAAASIEDDSTVRLNSGQLRMSAGSGDIVLGAEAVVDLSGAAVGLLDQTRYSSGGGLVLAAAGSITADAGSVIDVSAGQAAAGSVQATALAGEAAFDGTLIGEAAAGEAGGSFSLRTGTLADFDGLNALLSAGGFTQSRSFEIATGDLTVDATVAAHSIHIATDAGALIVTGTIDAHGAAPGSIVLAAAGDLTIAGGAMLDAHGTVAQADSSGVPIEAENRALVSLSTTQGMLRLDDSTIDVRAAVPEALGQLVLSAPRTVASGVETGDVAIDASGPIDILGAQSIVLYGSRTYTPTDAAGTITQHDDGSVAGAVSLDQLNGDNAVFIGAAGADAGLAARSAGLRAYGAAYQLRPADTIQSGAASGGDLTVSGDLDLSGLRYGPAAAGNGAGLAGLLTLRASNDLVVNGSITDGFAPPPDAALHTRDDTGWVLYNNDPLGQSVTLPADLAKPVVLASGTSFSTADPVALNFGITIAGANLAAGVVIPTPVVTGRSYTIPAGGLTATAAITDPSGVPIATRGQVLAAGTLIPEGSTLGLGTVLPFGVRVAKHTYWPAGASLSLFTDLTVRLSIPDQGTLSLGAGAVLPSGSTLVFANGDSSVKLRPTGADGVQGLIYATAALLPAGSQSWSINLVGGADLAAADLLAVQPSAALAPRAVGAEYAAGSVVLSDTHYTLADRSAPTASFSVVRTGTGTLNLVAGGDVVEASLFGVYTAGTPTSLGAADPSFQAGRAVQRDGTVLGRSYDSTYGAVVASQQANYPDHGGDVLVAAQGNVVGNIVAGAPGAIGPGTDDVGDWLWKQGGSLLGQATAWSINFGSYVLPLDGFGNVTATQPVLTGFTGIGALGGGNVSVLAGGDAGEVTPLTAVTNPISQGLVVAVGGTGRVTSVLGAPGTVSGGTTALTGGGALLVSVGGTLNPALQPAGSGTTLGGTLVDLRGDIDVQAGQVGRIDLVYDALNPTDPRPQDPFTTQFARSTNGPIVVPGDGVVTIEAMRDVVLAGAGDPGREPQQALSAIGASYLPTGSKLAFGGDTGFSLWTAGTAIDLFSAGGNLTPTTAAADGLPATIANDAPTDYRELYPQSLEAVAASGSFYYGQQGNATGSSLAYSLELAPSPHGQLSFLAAQSIYAHGYAVDMSGADDGLNALPNPYNPAYSDQTSNPLAAGAVTNFLFNTAGNAPSPDALFAFAPDTPTTLLHAGDTQPARIYAAGGDLVDVQFGEVLSFLLSANEPVRTWYLAAKPGWLMAGRDIVSSGTRPAIFQNGYSADTFTTFPNQAAPNGGSGAISSGNLLLNLADTDVSVLSAGRDILSSYAYVAGPGLLQVDAGRNIDATGDDGLAFGVLRSVGPVIDVNPAARGTGAGIAITAGTGAIGPDYTAFSALYLNDSNQADLSLPLDAPENAGKVQQTYQDQLYTWLQANQAYTGTEADAPAAFALLAPIDQDVFDRSVFYQELQASGRQQSDPASLFYKSYARGRTAIATLFPNDDASGTPVAYDGSLTMDSGTLPGIDAPAGTVPVFDGGISTLSGGGVQILAPGGEALFGTAGGPAPGASSGVITSGSGDIDIYALDSVLLGQSRIFTTFGGNILIWSAQGDINAGRGAKTTTIYQPPVISYDAFGGITLSPAAPTSGAGIATLAPIAGTLPGDVDLIAPLGTVDAGEAGIRVSGNLNIAALTVLNAANVKVEGKTSGNTAAVAVNTAAAATAAAAAGSSIDAATQAAGQRSGEPVPTPSVITVDIIGASGGGDAERRRHPAT